MTICPVGEYPAGTVRPYAPARNATQRNRCRCRECYGLAEFMLEETGKDYGLPRTPQANHATPPSSEHEEPRRFKPCNIRQPWEPRPSRRAA